MRAPGTPRHRARGSLGAVACRRKCGRIPVLSSPSRHVSHATERASVHDATHVPALAYYPAADAVHRVRDELPSGDLLVAPDEGRVGPAEAPPADPGALGDASPR